MSLYMNTDKPAMGSRIRPTTSKDNIGGGAGLDKLNKRVVKNAKFANVKSTLDTGANAGNVKVKVDRSGEMFRRVNRRQLHQLMLACESGDESIYRLQDRWDSVEDNDDAASTRSDMSARSHASNASYASSSSVASNATVIATHTSSTGSAPAASSPTSCASDYFILLDVRDDERQFKAFHIEGSLHYPPSCLRRDYFPPALYRFKNAEDKLIILVDSDETSRIGLECATLFLQKGFTNIFLLTGGLKHFGVKYQDRIVGEALQPPMGQGQQRGSMGSTSTGAGAGGVSNRSQALAGMPASSRPFTGASTSSAVSAASARPASSASARMHQQQQQQQSQQSQRPLRYSGTSLNFNGAAASSASSAAAAGSRPGPTQLGGGGFGSSRFVPEDRESPRAALGRQQQQQQQSSSGSSAAPSHRSRLSNGSAAGAAGVSTGGHAQISSRAFR